MFLSVIAIILSVCVAIVRATRGHDDWTVWVLVAVLWTVGVCVRDRTRADF